MISLRRLAGEVSVTLNLSSLFAPKSPFLFVLLLDQHFDKKKSYCVKKFGAGVTNVFMPLRPKGRSVVWDYQCNNTLHLNKMLHMLITD